MSIARSFASCFLLLIAAAASGQMTPQQVAQTRVVTDAVISPDGGHVAYVLSVPRDLAKEKDGGSWTELHVVDAKGNSKPFITGPVNVGSIAWTPDGTKIAFLAKREKDDARSLYVIPLQGGESRKIVSHSTDVQAFSFSGDGETVAFLATEPTPASRKKQRDQGFNQEIYEEDQPLTRVWVAPVADASSPKMLKLEGSASELQFNPKEEKIAVALAPDALIDSQLMFRKAHIVDLKTGEAKNLKNPGKLGQLSWSPDGKKLAMITAADIHDPHEGRLWVYENGGWKVDDKMPADCQVESLAWDKDGLLAQASKGVRSLISHRGRSEELPIGDVIANRVSATPESKTYAFIGHTKSHPPEVYIVDASNKLTHTDHNPWLKNIKLAKQEVVKYKARDGLELEGVLVRPLNEEPGKRYPLVLTVHGGPEAHFSDGWVTLYHSLGQVGAARGMAVFYPNYRGSTGRGVEFSMKGQAEAGGKEFDDLIDGVDHLIKMGLVDAKKVGITGGSYGGYATAWGSTYYSDRFAAGVMFVGISDWISCSGTTDIPQEMYLVHHRKWLWDDWDYFAKASPLKHLDKAKTPLLIMHGKNDPRVNPGQSLEMYRHLKVRGQAPVRLVLYPDEGHGNRRAASRLDYNLRLLRWMEHYLKGPGGAMPAMEIDYGIAPPAKTTSAGWNNRADPLAAACPSPDCPGIGRGCPSCIDR